jgi:hypothetical protein
MSTMKKKTAKPTKKKVKNGHTKKNGHSKNGHVVDVGNLEPAAAKAYLDEVADKYKRATLPESPSYRSLKDELGDEVSEFRDYLLGKYTNYHGHDMRKDVAWFLEQYGNGILSDIERAKRAERERIIAENRAKEEAERAAQEVAPK